VWIFESIKKLLLPVFFTKKYFRILGFNSLGKIIQNQRTIDPGYLKNVKETSGFYERSSALWVRVFDLFNSFENHDHFENCGHI
jgi:hypothetical protein